MCGMQISSLVPRPLYVCEPLLAAKRNPLPPLCPDLPSLRAPGGGGIAFDRAF